MDQANVTWEKTRSSLKQFQKREGHWNVPQSHKEDRCRLGRWVHNQRMFKKIGKLNLDRDEPLEDIGFQWGVSATWDEMYAMLQEFKTREGHCNVLHAHKEDGDNLGRWVNTQHMLKKIGKLNSDRDKLLEELAFNGGRRQHGTKCMPC
jgi:hypothetical protein